MEFNSFMDDFTESTLNNVVQQGVIYAFTNIYTLSLVSGMGIAIEDREDFLMGIQDQFKGTQDLPNLDFSYKLIPLKAIYTKGNPKLVEEEKDHLQWDPSKFKRTISPETQGLLIFNEVQLAKHLYHHSLLNRREESDIREKYMGWILLKLAIEQGKFCDKYLRNIHGHFIDKKDKTKKEGPIVLKEKKGEVNLLNQIHMMVAYASLYDLLNDHTQYESYDHEEDAQYFYNLANQLLNQSIKHTLFEEKTNTLATILPLTIEALQLLKKNDEYEEFIVKLCAELNARKLGSENLGNERFPTRSSSITTHGKALKSMVKGYEFTHYDHFLSEAHKTYHYLNQYWNDTLDLFDHKGNKKIKYSAKDVAAILGGLISLFSLEDTLTNKNNLGKQICSFFHSTLNITGLQTAPPILSEILNENSKENIDPLSISLFRNATNSCVLSKEFKIQPKKNKISVNPQDYNANYALYAVTEICSMTHLDLKRNVIKDDDREILEIIEELEE